MSRLKPTSAILLDLLVAGDATRLRSLMRDVPPGESVRLVSRLDRAEQRQLLMMLPPEDAAQVLKELSISQAAQLLLVLPAERAAALVELFPSNEQADLLAEMGDDADPVLASLSAETSERVRRLNQHYADTAGGLMVTEFLAYPHGATVGDVIEDLRTHAVAYSQMQAQYAYILDNGDRLIGVLRLRDLLLLERSEPVRMAMTPEPHRVRADATMDEVLRFFDRRPYFGVPVVDADDRLLESCCGPMSRKRPATGPIGACCL